MGVEITNRVLPGIGTCQEVGLRDGRRLGIVTRRSGLRDLVLYDEDGDGAQYTVSLSDTEATAVAELLGGPSLTFRLAALQQQADGLLVEQLPVPADSPYANRALGDTKARTRTGASVVAVLRQSAVWPSPTPDFVLRPGDLVVTVGTQEGVDAVARILDGSDAEAPPPASG